MPSVFQLVVSGVTTSVLLDGLTPLTEYLVSVSSMTGEKRSRPVEAADVTRELSFLMFSCPPSATTRLIS